MEEQGFNMLDIFCFTIEKPMEPDLMMVYRKPKARTDPDRSKLKRKPKSVGQVDLEVLKEILKGSQKYFMRKFRLITVNKSFKEPPSSRMANYAKYSLLWYKSMDPVVPYIRSDVEIGEILESLDKI